MIGGNDSQRRKSINIRKGFFTIFSRNEFELDPNFATISMIPDPNKKDTNGHPVPLGYSQNIRYISGTITDVQIQRRTRKIGVKVMTNDYIDIHLDSGGTPVIIELNFDSGPGKSFATSFRNVIPHLGNMLCLKAYQLDPEEGQENGRQGILVYANTIKPLDGKAMHIPAYYISQKTNPREGLVEGTHFFRIPSFEKIGRTGASEYDKDAALDWLYAAFREDVYYAFNHYELAEEEAPSFRDSPAPPQANNFYSNHPQANYGAAPANTPAPPAPPQANNYGTNQAPPPQHARPTRSEPVQNNGAYTNNQPMHETVAPPPPPPPARVYTNREPAPVSNQQSNNQNYNPNVGMGTSRQSPEASFDLPQEEIFDDLPF